jgi:hypothetical protein
MTTSLRQRMLQDLQLAGLSQRTQEAYLRAVRQLADHFRTPPDRLSEQQVRDYFLHLKNDRKFASASLGIAYSGMVHSQAAGDGQESLRYLAPYVFRVAIGDHRIVSCDEGKVTFAYRRVGSNRPRRMTLEAMEFLRRFLQHVLPAGFPKVRHYGFLSPNSSTSIEAVRWLITLHNGAVFTLRAATAAEPAVQPAPRCPVCGGRMSVLGFVPALMPAVFNSS